MIIRKDLKYPHDIGQKTLGLFRRAVVRPEKILYLAIMCVLLAGMLCVSLSQKNIGPLLFALPILSVCAAAILLDRSAEKKYLKSLSPEKAGENRSPDRTLVLNEDRICISYAAANGEEEPEWEYRLKNFRCFENEQAFLVCFYNVKGYLPLLKEWFDESEAAEVRSFLMERPGVNYKDLTGKCGE